MRDADGWTDRCILNMLLRPNLQSDATALSIIFINRFFYPDHSATSQMLSDLAFSLADRGHKISVITSRRRYDQLTSELAPREPTRGVDIHRVWTSRFNRHFLIGRAVDYVTFYVSATWMLWRLARAGDVIVAKTDPPMLSVVAAPIARWRGAKLVNWLQDIFPEVAQVLGVGRGRFSRLAYAIMRRLRNRSLKRAASNVALGERMAARLASLGVAPERICVIPNWADGAVVRPIEHPRNGLRAAWGLADKFVIGYSGNLGRAHQFATLLEAIERLEHDMAGRSTEPLSLLSGSAPPLAPQPDSQSISWLFIGGGALYGAFQREVAARRLSTVRFEPYQPRERLAESLAAADVHLVSLLPELEGLIVPSKLYGIAAAGRPTIFVGDEDGEVARVICKHAIGCVVAQGNGRQLANTIMELCHKPQQCREMGLKARRTFDEEFDKPIAVGRWEALLTTVAAGADA